MNELDHDIEYLRQIDLLDQELEKDKDIKKIAHSVNELILKYKADEDFDFIPNRIAERIQLYIEDQINP